MDKGLSGNLTGYELMCAPMYRGMTEYPGTLRAPLPQGHPYYVLLESRGSNPERDQNALENLIQQALEANMIEDAVFAFSQADLDWFWSIREDVGQLLQIDQTDQHFDISIPPGLIGHYIDETVNKLNRIEEVRVVYPFGHVADGNIHFIVGKSNNSIQLTNRINQIVYEPLQRMQGSVSAEHGIGLHKKEFIHFSKTETEIELMKSLKQVLDPLNILNRGKILSL